MRTVERLEIELHETISQLYAQINLVCKLKLDRFSLCSYYCVLVNQITYVSQQITWATPHTNLRFEIYGTTCFDNILIRVHYCRHCLPVIRNEKKAGGFGKCGQNLLLVYMLLLYTCARSAAARSRQACVSIREEFRRVEFSSNSFN